MCRRYFRHSDKQRISEHFAANPVSGMSDLVPDDNIAPRTSQPVIRVSPDGGVRELLFMRWGLVASSARRSVDFPGSTTCNAKAETISTQAEWREPFKRGRRCLVPADGFYEYRVLGLKDTQPFAFTVGQERLFAFAGLWDAWPDREAGDWLQSFTIITTQSNELTSAVHPRMPAILHESDYKEWLAQDDEPPPLHLLQPFPAAQMQGHAVSLDVKNKHPERLNSK